MTREHMLSRNVRPARAQDLEDEDGSELDQDVESSHSDKDGSQIEGSEDDDLLIKSDLDKDEGPDVNIQLSNVSFGALKQAQDLLSRKRKRDSDSTPQQDDKLEALRARLRQIKEANAASELETGSRARPSAASQTAPGRPKAKDNEDKSEDDSDSAPSEEGGPAHARSSKHAPTSLSSKHQVTRRRTVVDVPKRHVRDPRFDAMNQPPSDPAKLAKAYSFLDDYQKDEITELRAAIKKARTEEDKETLRRKMVSMENKRKAKEAKEREQEVLRRHRKEEKAKVEAGKKPFYLKRGEVKNEALVDKFKGMKGKEREKLIERRRIKAGQKEKRMMPDNRRIAR